MRIPIITGSSRYLKWKANRSNTPHMHFCFDLNDLDLYIGGESVGVNSVIAPGWLMIDIISQPVVQITRLTQINIKSLRT